MEKNKLPTPSPLTPETRRISSVHDLAFALASGSLNFRDTPLAKATEKFYTAAPKTYPKTPHTGLQQRVSAAIGGWHQLKNRNADFNKIQLVLQAFGWPKELSCVGHPKQQILQILQTLQTLQKL